MNEQTKESKFLDAINRYADQRMAQITQEIEEYKNEKIEQATEQGLQDAYDLIREDVTRRKAAIVIRQATEKQKLRAELFAERMKIRDKVFALAKEKLREFTKSADYTAFLQRSLQDIKERADGKVSVSVAPADEDKRALIQSVLPDADITVDSGIAIGGIKAYCPCLGMLFDDTLDSRLAEQNAWFIENSGLKVV